MPFDAKKVVNDRFIELLEAGTAPWRKPFHSGANRSGVTGRPYGTLNNFSLEAAGFAGRRWFTARQCMDRKFDFKGAKSSSLALWFEVDKKKLGKASLPPDSSTIAESKDKYLQLKLVGVFNEDQIKGVPAEPEKPAAQYAGSDIVEALTRNMIEKTGLTVTYGGDMACYIPSRHAMRIPHKRQFLSLEDFYATLLHEEGHSTSHASMLGRTLGEDFGTPEYAFEELCVEIASAQTAALIGSAPSETCMEQHAAYIKSWIRALKEDKDALFRAMKIAGKISDCLISFVPPDMLPAVGHTETQETPEQAEKPTINAIPEEVVARLGRFIPRGARP